MKLFYREFGEGPPLVILHGLYGSSDNWVTIAKKLGNSFRVLLPDQRNHGQSLHSDVHDYDSMRDDLFELTQDLKLRKFYLAGHSMGGKTAISFAMKWPEMLNGLLIADISPYVNEVTRMSEYLQHQLILKSMLSLDLSNITSRSEADYLLRESIPSEKIRGFILKNLQRSSDNIFSWKINVTALFGNLDKIMEGYDRNTVFEHQITGFPVIFLKGSESDYIQKEDYNDIKKLFPAAEFVELASAGHWVHADSPDEVIKNIKNLLGDS